MIRFVGPVLVALLCGILAACATKPKSPEAAASPGASPSPSPSPTPAATPAPSPTPQAHYTATAKVLDQDGNPVAEPTPEPAAPAPTVTPSPSPTASPTPVPSPTPAAGNFLTKTWAKIFPPKPTPTPEAPTLGDPEFRVVTDGQPAPASSLTNEPPTPGPTPVKIRTRPKEGFFARTWHMVFPRKTPPPAAAPPAWIGSIRLVNEPEHYALIDAPNYLSLPAGETLHAVGSTAETGVLRVTADRNPPFFIADIVSGRPASGDRVYSPTPVKTH